MQSGNSEDGEWAVLKRVKKFTYLGMKMEEIRKGDQGIKAKVLKGSHKYGMLRQLVRSKFDSRRTKERIHRTVTTAVYACET